MGLTDKARKLLRMTRPPGRVRAELLEDIYRRVRTFQRAAGDPSRKAALIALDEAVERLRLHDTGRSSA